MLYRDGMEFTGLPLHVLVVHAAVVFAPLAALAAIGFAVVPRWRYLTRWPAAVLAVIATGAIWLARVSGNDLKKNLALPDQLIGTHQSRGEVLSWVSLAFLLLVLVGAWLLAGPSGLASRRGAQAVRAPAVELVLPAAIVIASVVTLVYAVLTGDAGARAVWG